MSGTRDAACGDPGVVLRPRSPAQLRTGGEPSPRASDLFVGTTSPIAQAVDVRREDLRSARNALSSSSDSQMSAASSSASVIGEACCSCASCTSDAEPEGTWRSGRRCSLTPRGLQPAPISRPEPPQFNGFEERRTALLRTGENVRRGFRSGAVARCLPAAKGAASWFRARRPRRSRRGSREPSSPCRETKSPSLCSTEDRFALPVRPHAIRLLSWIAGGRCDGHVAHFVARTKR